MALGMDTARSRFVIGHLARYGHFVHHYFFLFPARSGVFVHVLGVEQGRRSVEEGLGAALAQRRICCHGRLDPFSPSSLPTPHGIMVGLLFCPRLFTCSPFALTFGLNQMVCKHGN